MLAPASAAAHALFRLPSLCAVCRRWNRGQVCIDCSARFAALRHRCRTCGLAMAAPLAERCLPCATTANRPLDRTVVAVDYAFPWDGLISAFKFGGRCEIADLLAGLLQPRLRDHPAEADALDEVDLVVPVPLGPHRLRQRGFNQAWELARRLVAGSTVSAEPAVLQRVRETAAQSGLDADERRRNLSDAFWVPSPALVAGRRMALVDDVMTTGATAREAARTLRAAGASSVQFWVVARTPAPADR